MSSPLFPVNINNYNDKQVTIKQVTTKRRTNVKTSEEYRFYFEVNDGELSIDLQKGTRRKLKLTKESQVKELRVPVLKQLLAFMKFESVELLLKLKLVNFVCVLLSIPTAATLEIDENNNQFCLCHQNSILFSNDICDLVIDYINKYSSNLSIISSVIIYIQSQNMDIVNYIKYIYDQLTINFAQNANSKWKYQGTFEEIVNSNESLEYKAELNENDAMVCLLTEFNEQNQKELQYRAFWFALNQSIFRLFNWNLKQFIIETQIKKLELKQSNSSSDISAQKKCAVYKFFGSAFNALCNIYKSKNYNQKTSDSLLNIVKSCLLTYNSSELSDNANNYSLEFFAIPLRLRLQNRGRLKLIHPQFYECVAIQMFDIIKNQTEKNRFSYDEKKMRMLPNDIMENNVISKAFHQYLQTVSNGKCISDLKVEQKVLKNLAQRVTTRYLRSVTKTQNDSPTHVGQHRTRIKSLYTV